MDNVVQLKPITDDEIERSLNILNNIDINTLPDEVKAALQQLAMKILQSTL